MKRSIQLRECLGLDPIPRTYFTHIVSVINGMSQSDDKDLSNLAVAFISNGGVVGANDYLVQAQGSPNNTIQVGVGRAYVPTVDGTMVYSTYLNASINVTIPSNSSGSARIDAIVLYINLAASPNAAATNVAVVANVQGTPAGSPVAPTNAQILAAIGSSNPYILVSNISVANGFTSINSGNITDKRAFAKISGGDTLFQGDFANYVHSGLTIPTSGSLTTTSTPGVLYFKGVNTAVASDGGHAYTASQDTYVDVSNSGAYSYNGVSNGASAPALTASSVRIAKVVTSGSAVSSVVQSGLDSNTVPIYPYKPVSGFVAYQITPTTGQTTASTTFVNMAAGTQSITLAVPSHVLALGHTNMWISTSGAAYIRTVYNDGSDHEIGQTGYTNTNTDGMSVSCGGIVTSLAAGTYTFALQMRVSNNTGTFNQPSLSLIVYPA